MDKRIRKTYDLIKKRYREKLTLAKLASSVDLSPFHFQRLFKAELNETPLVCINRLRLERSAHLIRINPKTPLSSIAADCGFISLSAFSRSFTKKFGMSPLKFAKQKIDYDAVPPAMKQMDVSIVRFPGATILYCHTSLFNSGLLDQFKEAVRFCELNRVKMISKKGIGVLTHISFHDPKNRLNYYAGVEVEKSFPQKFKDRVFILPAGKYVRFETNASYHELPQLMIQFKREWMDKMPYTIKDILAFEEINETNQTTDYPNLRRTFYMPIKKK